MDESNDQRQQRIKKLDPAPPARRGPLRHVSRSKDRAVQLVRLHGENERHARARTDRVHHRRRIVGLRAGSARLPLPCCPDGSERLQVYLKKDTLGEQTHQISGAGFGRLDRVTGILFRTKTNEFTVEAKTLTFFGQGPPSPTGKMARPHRCRDQIPSAVCGSHRQSAGARSLPCAAESSQAFAHFSTSAGFLEVKRR